MDYFTTSLNEKASHLQEQQAILVEKAVHEYFDNPLEEAPDRTEITVQNDGTTSVVADGTVILKIYPPRFTEITLDGETDTTIHLTVPYEMDTENGVNP